MFYHVLARLNTIMSMTMGEVNVGDLPTVSKNVSSPYRSDFYAETNFTAYFVFLSFCCTISVVVFNILTAFAIKVCNNVQIELYTLKRYTLIQDVQNCLTSAEINKLLKQAVYINLVEQSFLSR